MVAYGYLPSPRKPLNELDPKPAVWPPDKHPPLEEASQQPQTAKATAERRESVRRHRAAEAKPEKFDDIDVWPVVIRENISDSPNAPEILMAYAKRCGGPIMVKWLFKNWNKLPELISRSWKIEKVEEYVDHSGRSRLELLQDAWSKPCVCEGKWLQMAEELFQNNRLDQEEWCAAMLCALVEGRSKGNLVCHAGKKGNEGKSFLFTGLEAVFGEDNVFTSPPKGSFPLLGLERCRVVLLDDWRFNDDIIGYNLQLLWFEGKPIVIARPQNQFAGHLKYSKDDPVFITTLMSDITKVKGKKIEGGDVSMMVKRLKIFPFTYVLEAPSKCKACGHCFSKLLLRSNAGGRLLIGQDPTAYGPTGSQEPNAAQAGTGPAAAAAAAASADAHLPTVSSPVSGKRLAWQGLTGETPERKRQPASWTVDDVVKYLESLSLDHVASKFRHNGVDGAFLLELAEEDLVLELGLTQLQARKVKSRLP